MHTYVQDKKNISSSNANEKKTFSSKLINDQRKSIVQLKTIQKQIQNNQNNTGLPNNIKTGVERLSGYSMDEVKVHYNSSKPSQLHAHAYTQGNEIHVAPGQSKHLPHEAWHVVQQRQGRVSPTVSENGVSVNDNQALEKEADSMGKKAENL